MTKPDRAALDVATSLIGGGRAPLYHPNFPAVLFWSPKAACTPLLIWFLYHIGKLEAARAFSSWPHDYENAVLKARRGYRAEAAHAVAGRDRLVIKLVRNPFRRAVSSFLLLTEGIARKPDHFAYDAWRSMRERFYHDPQSERGVSFRQFLYWLEQQSATGEALNYHFAPQYALNEELFVARNLHAEALVDELRRLERELDLSPAPPEIFAKTSHAKRYGAASMPAVDMELREGDTGNFPDWRAFYDIDTAYMVHRFYRADFLAYGYDPDEPFGVI